MRTVALRVGGTECAGIVALWRRDNGVRVVAL